MTRATTLAAVLMLLLAAPAMGATGEGSIREMGAAFGKCVFAIAALAYVVGKLR